MNNIANQKRGIESQNFEEVQEFCFFELVFGFD